MASVTSSDIVVYGSGTMPEADTGTSGGAINLATKILVKDIGATDTVEIFSSSAADTSLSVVVTGRLASGIIDTDTIVTDASDGTTVVDGVKNFERILKVVFPAHAGTITVRRDADADGYDIATAEGSGTTVTGTTVTLVHRLFYKATANASGDANKVLYEKAFIRNNNSTNALLDATVTASSTALLAFDLEDAVDDNGSVSNRVTVVGSGTVGSPTWADTEVAVPGTDLDAGSAIGVWVQLTLDNGEAAAETSYTLTTAGSTT